MKTTTVESIKKDFDHLFNTNFWDGSDHDFRTVLEDKLDDISIFIDNQNNNILSKNPEKNVTSQLVVTINEIISKIK